MYCSHFNGQKSAFLFLSLHKNASSTSLFVSVTICVLKKEIPSNKKKKKCLFQVNTAWSKSMQGEENHWNAWQSKVRKGPRFLASIHLLTQLH